MDLGFLTHPLRYSNQNVVEMFYFFLMLRVSLISDEGLYWVGFEVLTATSTRLHGATTQKTAIDFTGYLIAIF
jgi:hypothetical protein